MKIGELNRRITFQSLIAVAGEGVTTWIDQFSVWAAIKPMVGNRRYLAQQIDARISGTVIVRYRADIIPSMRIKYGTRYFEIISVRNPDEANEMLEIDYAENQG